MQPPLTPPDEPDTDAEGRLLGWDGEVRCCPYCGDDRRPGDAASHRRCREIDREPT